MGLFDIVRNRLRGQSATADRPAPMPPPLEEEEEPHVPEVDTAALLAELEQGAAPLILDIRELFELTQVRLPAHSDVDAGWTSLHIPMNSLPDRLSELPADRELIVMCAHGNRSYGVTHYLNEQGFQARNLAGGITQWYIRGGPVETGPE